MPSNVECAKVSPKYDMRRQIISDPNGPAKIAMPNPANRARVVKSKLSSQSILNPNHVGDHVHSVHDRVRDHGYDHDDAYIVPIQRQSYCQINE